MLPPHLAFDSRDGAVLVHADREVRLLIGVLGLVVAFGLQPKLTQLVPDLQLEPTALVAAFLTHP